MMKVICISGHAQHGKDTSAEIMRKILWGFGKRVLIAHYGDLVKYICKQFFRWNGKKDEAGRTLLQYVGTDRVRANKPNYWVEFIAEILELFPDEWDYVLIPDCRFPNEIGYLTDKGFDVAHIRIVRDNFDNKLTEAQKNHPSETSLDNSAPDIEIHNDGDLIELERKLIQVVYPWENSAKSVYLFNGGTVNACTGMAGRR